jgi:hypothetical protein
MNKKGAAATDRRSERSGSQSDQRSDDGAHAGSRSNGSTGCPAAGRAKSVPDPRRCCVVRSEQSPKTSAPTWMKTDGPVLTGAHHPRLELVDAGLAWQVGAMSSFVRDRSFSLRWRRMVHYRVGLPLYRHKAGPGFGHCTVGVAGQPVRAWAGGQMSRLPRCTGRSAFRMSVDLKRHRTNVVVGRVVTLG